MASARRSRINARMVAALISLGTGVLFIVLGTMALDVLSSESKVGAMLFGRGKSASGIWPYPLTIQNLMWLMFFVGCGEIWIRLGQAGRDQKPIDHHLLPEDAETMLQAADLGPIYRRVNSEDYAEDSFLPRLIKRTILQFQSSRSVDQANSLMNSTLELCQHEIELRYNMLRYVVWLIPTLGFIGTVLGIAEALNAAAHPQFGNQEVMRDLMPKMIGALGVAFYTTLVALLQSAVLVFALHIAQAREEQVLNRAGQYCLDNLINRLYEK